MKHFEESKKYAVTSLLAVVVIGFLAWYGQMFVFGTEATAIKSLERERGTVPVEAVFDEKIVYTTDASHPREGLRSDCRDRGGEFNACGSPEEGVNNQGLVCAYTCSF